MLLIPCKVAPSPYGLGLFAERAIAQGEVVWKWNELTEIVYPWEILEHAPEPLATFLRTYGYFVPEEGIVVNLDQARYMNHSDTPNLEERDAQNIAVRDIAQGEELTCDYRVFDHELRLGGAFLKNASSQ